MADIEDNREEAPQSFTLLCLKQYSTFLMINSLICMVGCTAVLLKFTLEERRHNEEWFWISFACKNVALLSLQYVLGYGVATYEWHVGYTRKLVHIGFFLLPFVLDLYLPLPTEDGWLWAIWNVCIICWMLIAITKPVRSHIPLIQTMYKAVDRPEDKGLTQLYTILQVPLSMMIIAGFTILFEVIWDQGKWTLCPIIAVTFGDGLAEPVAVFWEKNRLCGGLHKYKAYGLCSGGRSFTRSVEGSMTVFIWSAISVCLIYDNVSHLQYAVLLAVFPLTMTLLEMVAPHSMDNPFLLLWGYLIMTGVHFL